MEFATVEERLGPVLSNRTARKDAIVEVDNNALH